MLKASMFSNEKGKFGRPGEIRDGVTGQDGRLVQFDGDGPASRRELCVIVVDPHPLVRLGLKFALEGLGAPVRVVEAGDLDGALSRLDEEAGTGSLPDLLILDLALPGQHGLFPLLELHHRYPGIPVVLFCPITSLHFARDAFREGATGFITKSMEARLMPIVLRFILEGGVYIPRELLEYESEVGGGRIEAVTRDEEPEVSAPSPADDLSRKLNADFTARQIDVIRLMVQGLSNKEISRRLQISTGTVKNHVAVILQRMGVASRARAIGALYAKGELGMDG